MWGWIGEKGRRLEKGEGSRNTRCGERSWWRREEKREGRRWGHGNESGSGRRKNREEEVKEEGETKWRDARQFKMWGTRLSSDIYIYMHTYTLMFSLPSTRILLPRPSCTHTHTHTSHGRL